MTSPALLDAPCDSQPFAQNERPSDKVRISAVPLGDATPPSNARTGSFRRIGLLLLMFLLIHSGIGSVSEAQVRSRWYHPVGPYPGGYSRGVGFHFTPFGFNFYGMPYSSTPQEAAARGMADMIRAQGQLVRIQGQAAEQHSRAMVNYEAARSQYIENEKEWQKLYMERKRTAAAEREARSARQRASRDRYLEIQRSATPPQLSSDQFDPTTGHLNWPKALQSDDYATFRSRLDELLVVRAHTRHTDDLGEEIQSIALEMQSLLRQNIREMPSNQYLEARKFLDALIYLGQSSAG